MSIACNHDAEAQKHDGRIGAVLGREFLEARISHSRVRQDEAASGYRYGDLVRSSRMSGHPTRLATCTLLCFPQPSIAAILAGGTRAY